MSDEKSENDSESALASSKATASIPPIAEDSDANASEPAAENHAHENHGHDGPLLQAEHGAQEAASHGLAHTMPISLLVGVLVALMGLTILTVSVTHYDLGSEGNLVIAMIIATIKAGLVVTFFMHLLWDKKFHLILFLTAVLFVVLFLSMSLTDRGEYQPRIDEYSQTAK